MARYEDRDDSSVVLGVAAGLIVGVAIGGVLGLLFAPKSGEELRSDIKDRADEAIDRLNDASSELATRAKELGKGPRAGNATSRRCSVATCLGPRTSRAWDPAE